jgi:hypothetical protein
LSKLLPQKTGPISGPVYLKENKLQLTCNKGKKYKSQGKQKEPDFRLTLDRAAASYPRRQFPTNYFRR